MKGLTTMQAETASRVGTVAVAISDDQKVGVSRTVLDKGLLPLNALRHSVSGETSGWYVWAGEELSDDDDFFVPLHVSHVKEWCAEIVPYLGLPPGWRVLLAPDYEDVWYDESLLSDS